MVKVVPIKDTCCLYEMEKMLRNGVVPYVFVKGLLFSGKKIIHLRFESPKKNRWNWTSNFLNKTSKERLD